jgi:metal-dependent amidase/aminoacylase/carboxypeptidase family protein
MVIALQTFVTRSVDVFAPEVITVGKIEAGTTDNVIPASATLTGTIRTVAPATRQLSVDGIRRVARGIAEAHGVSADVQIDDGYPVTANDATVAQFVLEVGRRLLGEDRHTNSFGYVDSPVSTDARAAQNPSRARRDGEGTVGGAGSRTSATVSPTFETTPL